jgi:hypothetical protein
MCVFRVVGVHTSALSLGLRNTYQPLNKYPPLFPISQDFSPHLPLLLHAAVVLIDAEESLVAGYSTQLLVHLLYSLSAANMEGGGGSGKGSVEEDALQVRIEEDSFMCVCVCVCVCVCMCV